jgi:hypothetical protein
MALEVLVVDDALSMPIILKEILKPLRVIKCLEKRTVYFSKLNEAMKTL